MASNVEADPGTGGAVFKTTDNAGVHTPHTNVDNTVAVTGPLTDTQLRATAVPVSGTVTTGGLTDAQLRATAVPVSGTVTASGPLTDTQLRATAVPVSLATLPALVPGSATIGAVNLLLANVGASHNSGVKDDGTLRVILATDQPALTNKLLVTPDSVALPANQSVNNNQVVGTTIDVNSGLKSAGTMRVVLATDQPALTNKLLVTPDSVALPANQSVNMNQIVGTAVDVNSGTKSAGTQRVVLATDQPSLTNALPVAQTKSATATTSQVADNAASVTVLASNANRLGATIENDSTAKLYVKFGTTASLTDYTVQIATNGYYEVPFNYTGRIDGIWATDPNTGSARVTEMTA